MLSVLLFSMNQNPESVLLSKKVKAKCRSQHQQGFYVYAKPNLCVPKTIVKYTGRYLGLPAIATFWIDKYDGEMVTFHYSRHEDGQYIEEMN